MLTGCPQRNVFLVKSEWGYNIVLRSKESTTASRGVIISINNNFSCEDNFNRPGWKFCYYGFIVLKFTLVSIGPNEDKTNFYENLKQKIQDF